MLALEPDVDENDRNDAKKKKTSGDRPEGSFIFLKSALDVHAEDPCEGGYAREHNSYHVQR